jgi:hypothetical protein
VWQDLEIVLCVAGLGKSAVCGRTWKIIVEPERLQMTICLMRYACWVSKVTNKIKNVKFTLEQDTKAQRGIRGKALLFL